MAVLKAALQVLPVSLSVPNGLVIKIGINVTQGTIKWSRLKNSKVEVTGRHKSQKLPHIWCIYLLTGGGRLLRPRLQTRPNPLLGLGN